MNQVLRFAGAAALFAGSLMGAAWLVGALSGGDGGGPVAIPVVDVDAPVVAVAEAGVGFPEGIAPIDQESPAAGAEVLPVDADSPAGDTPGGSGSSGAPDDAGGTGSSETTDGSGGTGSSEGDEPAEGDAYPWVAELGEFAPGAPGVPWLPEAWMRFRDLCADGAGVGCPAGIGGTVLAFGGGGEPEYGDFDAFAINSTPTEWWQCSVDDLGEFEIPVLVAANHPARLEISYSPVGEPALSRSVIVDLTAPDGASVRDFISRIESGGSYPDGVHHCFALELTTMEPAVVVGDGPTRVVSRFRYQVDVAATSFTGQTDMLSGVVDMGTVRPAVSVMPLSEYEVRVSVPVRSDPTGYSIVRFLEASGGVSCSDAESGVLAGESLSVAPSPAHGRHEGREPMTATIVGPSRIDPTYDTWDTWTASLVEGTDYVLCVWWVLAPERSFDSLSVVDRESRLVSTPDMLRTVISVSGMGNNATDGTVIRTDSYRVSAPAACALASGAVSVPPAFPPPGDLEPGFAVGLPDMPVCVYPGTLQPNHTRITVLLPDGSAKHFMVPSFRSTIPWETFSLLDVSPSPESAAEISLRVTQVAGVSNGLREWEVGTPGAFAGADTPATELPAEIQLDWFNSRVEAVDRESLRVSVGFDRPVTLAASLEGEPCLTGDAAEIGTDGTSRREHEFVIGGLCTLSEYSVQLVATAADGTTRAFSDIRHDWDGAATTDGYHVRYTVSVGRRGEPGLITPYHARWSVRVAGEQVPVGAPSRCLESATSAMQTGVWGEETTLSAYVHFYTTDDGLSDRGYCIIGDIDDVLYQEGYASRAITFTIADFTAGDVALEVGEFLMTFPVVRPWGTFTGLEVVISGTVDG